MKRTEVAHNTAQSVADTLFQTEAAIDAAMCQIAAFTQSLPSAGKSAGFSATRGQGVYERLADAMVCQSQARARIVEVHGMLAELKDDSFMRTVMIGGGTKDGEPNPVPRPNGLLSLVSATG